MHPLDGPRRKLDRAMEHIKTLHDAIGAWNDTKPVKVVSNFDSKKMDYIFRFEYTEIPPSLGIIVGDILHNMRSALDHLVWQLALLNTTTPYVKTAFPICVRNDKETRSYIKRLTANIPDDARKVIESLQPYNTPNGITATHHALWVLDQLSNFDKHRIVTVRGGATEVEFRAGTSEKWLNDGAIEITVHVTDKNLPPSPPKIKFHLLVGSNVIENGMPLVGIRVLHDFIRLDVLPKFECFFP